MNVYEAILAVMADVGTIGKSDTNTFHGYKFRGVDRVLNAVGPALRRHKLVVTPRVVNIDSRDVLTSKDKREREVTVTVEYHFRGPDGDTLDPPVTVLGEASDAGDKAVSKAQSVAQRTAYIQAFNIPTGDTDPDHHNMQRGAEDPLAKVKQEIWDAADAKGWIEDDNAYQQLSDDFAQWTRGEGRIEDADLAALQEYLVTLRPHKRMQRASAASSNGSKAAQRNGAPAT